MLKKMKRVMHFSYRLDTCWVRYFRSVRNFY